MNRFPTVLSQTVHALMKQRDPQTLALVGWVHGDPVDDTNLLAFFVAAPGRDGANRFAGAAGEK